jgi:hypothetical protein
MDSAARPPVVHYEIVGKSGQSFCACSFPAWPCAKATMNGEPLCTCHDVMLDSEVAIMGGAWNEDCDVHGVGTSWFRALKVKPFGYSGEAGTTREAWLKWKASG